MSSVNVKKLLRTLLEGTKATTGYYGFGDFAANTDSILSEIYTAPAYTDADRVALAAFFARADDAGVLRNAVTVLSEYPRTVKDLPAIFVFRTGDSEHSPGYLGDLYDEIDDDLSTDHSHADTMGTNISESISLHLWASGDGALRDDLYLAMRELVIRGRKYLIDGGVEIPQWKNGKDGQLFQEDARPQIIHTAEATITCRVPLTWPTKEARALDFQGHDLLYGGRVTVLPFTDE